MTQSKTTWLNDPIWGHQKAVGTLHVSKIAADRTQKRYSEAFHRLMEGFAMDFQVVAEKVEPVYPEIEALHELLDVLGIDRSNLA